MWCKRVSCVLVVAFIPALAACEPEAEPSPEPGTTPQETGVSSAPAALMPIDHSDVTGTVVVDYGDDQADVTLAVEGLQPDSSYLAFIHDERCAAAGSVLAAPLGRLTADSNGEASERLRASVENLRADGDWSVHIQATTGETLACANIRPR